MDASCLARPRRRSSSPTLAKPQGVPFTGYSEQTIANLKLLAFSLLALAKKRSCLQDDFLRVLYQHHYKSGLHVCVPFATLSSSQHDVCLVLLAVHCMQCSVSKRLFHQHIFCRCQHCKHVSACLGLWFCRFPSTAWPILTQLLKSHQPPAKRNAKPAIAKHTAKDPKPLTKQASKPSNFSSRPRVRFDITAEEAPDTGYQQEHGSASSPVHESGQVALTHQHQCIEALQTACLTKEQREFCEQIGLGTRGPAGTVADAECLFRSFAQSDAMISKGTLWAMIHSEGAQSKYAVLRHTAAAQIRGNSLIQDGLVQYAEQLTILKTIVSKELTISDC